MPLPKSAHEELLGRLDVLTKDIERSRERARALMEDAEAENANADALEGLRNQHRAILDRAFPETTVYDKGGMITPTINISGHPAPVLVADQIAKTLKDGPPSRGL